MRAGPATPRDSTRVAAIINPSTRGDARALIAALEAACPASTRLDIYRTTNPGEAVALANAASAMAAIVIAVGGDGTVADVVTGLAGAPAMLGIMPAGSTNITAQELGIPGRAEDAAALIFGQHRIVTMDVGRCGERRFLHMAGAGLDSHFFERTSRALKRRVGWLAYVPAATVAIRQAPARFTIDVDTRRLIVTSPMVLVANGGSIISPVLRLHPDVRSDDGWLDVLVFTATRPGPIARTIWQFVTGSLAASPYVVRMRGRAVRLSSDPPLPVQLDGDVVTRTPATFSLEAGGIGVIAPATAGGTTVRSDRSS
ncbi:MAG: hypothetical protein H0V24_16420 [Chloroflexia bacterium]|nr:hypothetical protein [Chloroflexia bacterium]